MSPCGLGRHHITNKPPRPTAHDAFRALINLTDSSLLMTQLSDPPFLGFLISYILHPPSILVDLASMLLSNLTTQPSVCSSLLKLTVPVLPISSASPPFYAPQSRSGTSLPPTPYPSSTSQDMQALPLLVQAFVQGARVHPSDDLGLRHRKGELHFLSSVFANISVTPEGRSFFLTPRPVDPSPFEKSGALEFPLSQLVDFTEHVDTIRRGGVASTIKNCAFQTASHRALLSPVTEAVSIPPSGVSAVGVNVLPYILLPLAGPEEYDLEVMDSLPPAVQFLPDTKKREQDPTIRLTHVETLLLLCTTRWGREQLRATGVYEVVKMMHQQESDDIVAETIERLVNFLKRDEDSAKDDENDPGSVQGGERSDEQSNLEITLTPTPSDDDEKIEEV